MTDTPKPRFIVCPTLDRLTAVMAALDGKADLRGINVLQGSDFSDEEIAEARLCDDVEGLTASFLAEFHEEKEAALFRLFFEDDATLVTDSDQIEADERREARSAEMVTRHERDLFWKDTILPGYRVHDPSERDSYTDYYLVTADADIVPGNARIAKTSISPEFAPQMAQDGQLDLSASTVAKSSWSLSAANLRASS